MKIDVVIPTFLWMALFGFGVAWLGLKFAADKDAGFLLGAFGGLIFGMFTWPLPCWVLEKLGATLDWSGMEMLNGGGGFGGF